MSVSSMVERAGAREGRRDRVRSTYTREFQIKTTVGTDDAGTVLDYASLPAIGAAYPGDSRAVCTSRQASPDQGDPTVWSVRVQYDSGDGANQGSKPKPEEITDPTDQPAEISWGKTIVRKAVRVDNGGLALVNSAGDQFDPLPEDDKYLLTVQITRIEDYYLAEKASEYYGAVNSSTVGIADYYSGARQVVCVDYSGTRTMIDGKLYWRVTYGFIFDPDTWDLSILDVGYNAYTTANDATTKKPIKMADGTFAASPQFLNSNGTRNTSTYRYCDFRVKQEVDFSRLRLGFI